MVRRVLLLLMLAWLVAPAPSRAQVWNDSVVVRLIGRAVDRRADFQADSGLNDYRARAHGFVFFLGQLGAEFSESPRLIKSDQLELEVYWTARGASKQRIIGWRDRADLPTDIQYHRDHLGIVTNNFSDRIGLGHNDEVNDVPHPLSPTGPERYEYALWDSLTIRLPNRTIRVFEVLTRPQRLDLPGLVGSLFLDMESAALVRLRFNFTRAAYVDPTLEDITVLLENALWDGKYWLPRYQETEIRRRASWLDFPARGIIRSRWSIDDYEFNVGTPAAVFVGPEIVALPARVRETYPWEQSLDDAIRDVTGPIEGVDVEAVRAAVRSIAPAGVLSALPAGQVGGGSLSELIHVNRVEGLAVGAGLVVRPASGETDLRLSGSFGASDKRAKGTLTFTHRSGRARLRVRAERAIRDVGDERVIAPLLNSVVAQEGGHDFGDYFLHDGAQLEFRYRVGASVYVSVATAVEHVTSVRSSATPVSGSFRPNPELGDGTFGVITMGAAFRPAGSLTAATVAGDLQADVGAGEGVRYLRVRGSGRARVGVGRHDLDARGWVVWGSKDLPRHRSVVLGGRGSLVSEPFRVWGGRYGAFGTIEWRLAIDIPSVALGPLVPTDRIVVAPFVSAGWAAGLSRDPTPWRQSAGVRTVVGVGIEWLYGLLRTDVGVSIRNPHLGVVVDIRRDLWGVL